MGCSPVVCQNCCCWVTVGGWEEGRNLVSPALQRWRRGSGARGLGWGVRTGGPKGHDIRGEKSWAEVKTWTIQPESHSADFDFFYWIKLAFLLFVCSPR